MENVRPQMKTIKQAKGRHTTVPKRCLFGRRPYFDLKKDEILNKSEVLEDIKKGLITGFEITAVKHKD